MLSQKPPQKRSNLRIKPRAEFVKPTDLIPIIGTISRAKRLVKATRRSYRFLKRRRAAPDKRLIGSALSGANSLLSQRRIQPTGALLYVIDRTGKGFVKGLQRGGIPAGLRQANISRKLAAGNVKRAVEKVIRPGTVFASKSSRAYRMLGDSANPAQKLLGSSRVGANQVLKAYGKKGVGAKLYSTDKSGKRAVRRVKQTIAKLRVND